MQRTSNLLSMLVASGMLLLLCGCEHDTPSTSARPEIWMTYAANIPHAGQQRVNLFVASEAPAIVVSGFPLQTVVISLHEEVTGRLLFQSTQYSHSRAGIGLPLKPLRPGHYVVRASQEGVLKAQSDFTVR
jgi:hypothetical protein